MKVKHVSISKMKFGYVITTDTKIDTKKTKQEVIETLTKILK